MIGGINRLRYARCFPILLLTVSWAIPIHAGEVQSQHALDTSIKAGKWRAVLHSRARTRLESVDLYQFRVGPIVDYSLTSRVTLIGGYYFARNEREFRLWSTTHRPFVGGAFATQYRRANIEARSLVERFFVPGAGDFNRYRQRVLLMDARGPYSSVEGFVDAAGLRSMRYGAGWRIGPKSVVSIDLGYFFETRRLIEGGNRHMFLTSIHIRRQGKRIDPDP
jgi:hypothetical protein